MAKPTVSMTRFSRSVIQQNVGFGVIQVTQIGIATKLPQVILHGAPHPRFSAIGTLLGHAGKMKLDLVIAGAMMLD